MNNGTLRRRLLQIVPWVFFPILAFAGKDDATQTLVWPQTGSPVVRLTFGKFKEVGSVRGERSLVAETTAQNLWDKKIARAGFTVYVFESD